MAGAPACRRSLGGRILRPPVRPSHHHASSAVVAYRPPRPRPPAGPPRGCTPAGPTRSSTDNAARGPPFGQAPPGLAPAQAPIPEAGERKSPAPKSGFRLTSRSNTTRTLGTLSHASNLLPVEGSVSHPPIGPSMDRNRHCKAVPGASVWTASLARPQQRLEGMGPRKLGQSRP